MAQRLTDSVEETVDLEVLLLAVLDVLDGERLKQVAVSLALSCDGLGMVSSTLLAY